MTIAPGSMFKVLAEVEDFLLHDLADAGPLDSDTGWLSKYIDYTPPLVERAYRQWGDYRISLHCIYPCDRDQAFLHPHPWPAAFRVFGEYEVGFGYSTTNEPPEVTHTIRTTRNFAYEMTDPNAWHYVAPLKKPVYTIMVNGPTWGRDAPRTANAPFRELAPEELSRLRRRIQDYLVSLKMS